MPMSNHAARSGHVILRTVLIALSIAVLVVCMLMWWFTVFDAAQPMADTQGAATSHPVAAHSHAVGTGKEVPRG